MFKSGSKYLEYYSFGMAFSANQSLNECILNNLRENNSFSYQPAFGIINKCITEKNKYNWSLLATDEKVLVFSTNVWKKRNGIMRFQKTNLETVWNLIVLIL